MASKTSKRSICLLTLALFSIVHSFMDIEELQSINYGINILKEPIVIPEVSFTNALFSIVKMLRYFEHAYFDYFIFALTRLIFFILFLARSTLTGVCVEEANRARKYCFLFSWLDRRCGECEPLLGNVDKIK